MVAGAIVLSIIVNAGVARLLQHKQSKVGESVQERTIDGVVYTVTKDVTQTSKNSYSVVNTVAIDGVEQSVEVFEITQNSDDTFTLSNSNIGLDKTFTDVPVTTRGDGYSSYSGAAIVLSDTESGSANTLRLYDNYSACSSEGEYIFNHAVMEGIVRVDTVDVTWESSLLYLHYCFYHHVWDHGYVQYGSQTYNLDTDPDHSDRRSSHTFDHTQGIYGTHSITTMFFYGDW